MAGIKIPISVELGDSLQKLKGVTGELVKIDGEAKQVNKDAQNTGQAIAKIGDSAKGLGSGPVQSFKGQLRAATQELYTMTTQFGAGSEQAKNAAKRVAELKDAIGDAKLLTDAFNPDAKFTALGNALKGVAGGFSIVTGAQAIFGSESKAVQETLAKVQGAMALSQGINSVLEAKDAFIALGVQLGIVRTAKVANNALDASGAVTTAASAVAAEGLAVAEGEVAIATTGASAAMGVLKTALIATGIGAAVVAVGLLVANFDSIKEAVGGINEKTKAYNDTVKDLQKGMQGAYEETNKVKSAFDLARSGVISKKEALKVYNDTLGDSFGKTNDLNEAEKKFNQGASTYIQIVGLKAQANALFAKAAEAAAKGTTAGLEDQTGVWDMLTASAVGFFKGSKGGFNSLADAQSAGVDKIEKKAKLQEKTFNDLANSLLQQAAALEKQSKIKVDLFGDGEKSGDKQAKDVKTVTSILKELNDKIDGLQNKELQLGTSTVKDQISAVNETLNLLLTDKNLRVKVSQSQLDALAAQLDSLERKERFLNYKAVKIENPADAAIKSKRDEIEKKFENAKPIEIKTDVKIQGDYKNVMDAPSEDIRKKAEELTADLNTIISTGFTDLATGFGEALGEALSGGGIKSFLTQGLSVIGQMIQDIGKLFIKQAGLVELIQKTIYLQPGIALAAGIALVAVGAAIKNKASQKFSTGGFVSGPGTETSDSIPAYLSDGEYVIKAATVKKYGKGFFDRLNQGQVNASTMPKFASGGYVRKFAEGGMVFANGSRALVNRIDITPLTDTINQMGRVIDSFVQKSRALVNRVDDTINVASRGTSRALVNRAFVIPTQAPVMAPIINEVMGQQVPYIASTEIKGQDLRIVLNRATSRFNNVS